MSIFLSSIPVISEYRVSLSSATTTARAGKNVLKRERSLNLTKLAYSKIIFLCLSIENSQRIMRLTKISTD